LCPRPISNGMKLGIYTLEKTLFEGNVEKVIARTPLGEITVLDKHIPLLSMIQGPRVDIVDSNGKKDTIRISSGFLEVKPESEVTILGDSL